MKVSYKINKFYSFDLNIEDFTNFIINNYVNCKNKHWNEINFKESSNLKLFEDNLYDCIVDYLNEYNYIEDVEYLDDTLNDICSKIINKIKIIV